MHDTTIEAENGLAKAGKPTRISFKRLIAVVSASALAFGGLTLGAVAPASAAVTDEVTSLSGSWNILDRWVNYVMYAPAGPPPYTPQNTSSISPNLPDSCTLVPAIYVLTTAQDSACKIPLSGNGGIVDADSNTLTGVGLGDITFSSGHFPDGVTFSNLEITTSGSTATVTADISGDSQAVPTATNDVEVATFDLSSVTPTISANQVTYTNLVGTTSTTIGAVIPSWNNLNYQGVATAPLTFTTDLTTPSVTATVASATATEGVKVNVTGDGFRGVTNTDDNGVYVGLYASGGLPNVSSQAGAAAFAAAQWIPAASLTNGSFTTTLTAPASKLVNQSYSVYTWQAHTHSNTSQDTETPVTISQAQFSSVFGETASLSTSQDVIGGTVTLNIANWKNKARTTGSRVGIKLVSDAVPGGYSHVAGNTVHANATIWQLADLDANGNGTITIQLPDGTTEGANGTTQAVTPGNYRIQLLTGALLPPAGSDTVRTQALDLQLKTATTTTLKLSRERARYLSHNVTATATVPGATGQVEFFVNNTSVGKNTLSNGIATRKLKKSWTVGTYTVTAKYLGSNDFVESSSAGVKFQQVKASTSKVTVTAKAFKKRAKPKVTVNVAKLNNGKWAKGKVRVYVGNKLVRTVTLKTAHKGKINVTLPRQSKTIKVKARYMGNTNVAIKTSKVKTIRAK